MEFTAKIKDIYGTIVTIQESGSGYFRLDFKGESFPEKEHNGSTIPCCVSFTENNARVLQSALNEYFEQE